MPLPQPVLVHNVDGSTNKNGSVMEEVHVTLHFRHHSERAHLASANLRQQMVIIGHSWLTLHNPEVDWAAQKISMMQCPSCSGQVLPKPDPPLWESTLSSPEPEDMVYVILLTLEWEECIHATSAPSHRLVEEAQAQQAHLAGKAIPDHYKDFMDVFSEEAFTPLRPCKTWDHAIPGCMMQNGSPP